MSVASPTFDPASFRDPEGKVIELEGRIYRTLSKVARERLERFESDSHLRALAETELHVPSHLLPTSESGLDPAQFGETIVAHERLRGRHLSPTNGPSRCSGRRPWSRSTCSTGAWTAS